MANVYSIAFTILGVVIAHCCLLVWTMLVLPRPVERARRRIEGHPIVSFLVGLFLCLATAAAIGGFFMIRARIVPRVDEWLDYASVHLQFTRIYNDAWILTNLLVWIIAIPVLAGFIFGGAGLAQIFAIRSRAMMRDDRPLLGLTYGAFCTSAAYFLPVAGWFVFLPIVGLISIGAGVWGMFGRSAPRGSEIRSASARHQESTRSSR